MSPTKVKSSATSLIAFLLQIQLALFRFQSLLLTKSLLISLPAGTKTLQFPAFPCLAAHYTEVRFGNFWFNTYLQLARTYRSLSRPSSAS